MSLLAKALKHSNIAFKNQDSFLLFFQNNIKRVQDHGIDFLLHFYDPSVDNTSTNPPTVTVRDKLMPPYEPYIQIERFTNHYLILNRFQFCPGHMIVASDSGREIQGSPLTYRDFKALSRLISGVDDKGVVYYNGGVSAGCTQYHKHMQYVPCTDNPLFDAMVKQTPLPHKYYISKLKDYSQESIGEAYLKLMEKAAPKSGYNMCISKGFLTIVPRTKARHSTGVLINSLGVCGHLFVTPQNVEDVGKSPLKIISSLCEPV